MYLLDTDIVSLLHAGNPAVSERFRASETELVVISIITRIELLRARFEYLLKASDVRQLLEAQQWLDTSELLLEGLPIVPIDGDVAAEVERLGTVRGLRKIGRADLLIAATALANRATLVTRNLKHFRLVPNLSLENWAD